MRIIQNALHRWGKSTDEPAPAPAEPVHPTAERSANSVGIPEDLPGTLEAAEPADNLRDRQPTVTGARARDSLGVTLRLLEEGRTVALAPPALRRLTRAPKIPDGALYEARAFACDQGSRDYKLYVPARADEGLRGLVVMLHGCKQDADDFAAGTAMNTQAERERLLVAYPCQSTTHNPLGCWNWFNPSNQRRDSGEPAIIAGIARSLLAEFSVEKNRAMVAGLSAGGSMAAVLGATYPDLFGAIGVHSGLPHGSAHDAVSALAVMRGDPGDGPGGVPSTPTIVFHGDADRTVHPDNAVRILAAAGPGEIRQESGRSAGGRAYRVESLTDARGESRLEVWMVAGAGHAWSGGDPTGSYTEPEGPEASAEMVRFFLRDR